MDTLKTRIAKLRGADEKSQLAEEPKPAGLNRACLSGLASRMTACAITWRWNWTFPWLI